MEYILRETEQLHGKVRRYTSPDEHAFYPGGEQQQECASRKLLAGMCLPEPGAQLCQLLDIMCSTLSSR
jgi:hypothetical protein